MLQTVLVIWDEAPMVHRHMMEAVDRTFQDILGSDRPFGGVPFVFGGDFQQILPVIPGASRGQTVGACLQHSMLWRSITVIQLYQNMRLNTEIAAEREFAKWQLEVGQGKHTSSEGSMISLPDHMKCRENTVDCLIDTIYPGISTGILSANYFSERTILSSLNVDVDSLNMSVLSKLPGESKVFNSVDSIPTSEQSGGEDPMLNYPVEYLNQINCSGLPLAKLELKTRCPVMILLNLDPAHEVCNGSRGILRHWGNKVLEVELLTGEHAGSKVFIPRIGCQPTEDQVAFKFTRKQFPVRLCFSMTINKSQGQSVKHVGLDLRSPVFTHGQFYVGVSRVTSWRDIKVIWDDKESTAVTKNIVFDEVLLKE
jgi:ATP-dependent DNA helicase PIF1